MYEKLNLIIFLNSFDYKNHEKVVKPFGEKAKYTFIQMDNCIAKVSMEGDMLKWSLNQRITKELFNTDFLLFNI